MSITGEAGGPPAKSGNPVADINAGLLAVSGITAAYVHKLRRAAARSSTRRSWKPRCSRPTGTPRSISRPARRSGPSGSAHPLTAPYQAFRASDGWINIGGANQANWERIADVLGHPEWRADPRFATNSERMQNLPALVALMNAVLGAREPRPNGSTRFDAAGVPVGPVHTIGEALSHPQTLARGMVVDLVHPEAGATKALGCPIHFSGTPTAITRPAPRLGEHTREVLREHGYADGDIDAFVAAGVVEVASEP